jgi:hypothetical protein
MLLSVSSNVVPALKNGGTTAGNELSYVDAKRWLREQGGTFTIFRFEGRPVVVVGAFGLNAQISVERNSVNHERAAFIAAVRTLIRKFDEP